MLNLFNKLWKNERGNALILAGSALPLLIGSAGLATDTIQWALWKRQLQRTADSAAIAGVYARIRDQDATAAVTTDVAQNNKTQIALLSAPAIGFPSDTGTQTRTVSVGLQIQQKLNFTSLFMSTPPIITANATASAIPTGTYCVVSLENTNATGITAGGSAAVDLGCGMITNSTSMDAAVAFGSSTVNASPVAAVGGLDSGDNWATGTTLLPFTLQQEDPYADVNPPTPPSPCNEKFNDKPHETTPFPAGCYSSINIQGTVTLSGEYIVTGDFSVGSQAHVTCDSCTIIMTNNNPTSTGTLDINAGAELDLKAPTTGTYAGILFYQNRGATANVVNKINGNSDSTFQGAFYFPNQQVEFTGTAGLTYNCLHLVSRRVTFIGNSTITNSCPVDSGVKEIVGRHVRLIA